MSGASNLFRTDLGLGVTQGSTIPCLHITGISPPAGFDLICTITTLPSAASITSPVMVTVSGFIKITASSNIVIHFPGVKYVQTAVAPTYTITTYQITNRIRADMDTGTVTGVAGSIVPANTASGVTITISNQRVQATSTISLGLPLTTTVATGATLPYLLFQITPTHDLGYCKSSTISCTVDGVARSCVCYHEIDMILITLTATFAAGSHTFSLIGLQNPESVPTTPDNMILYTCGNQGIVQRFTFAGNIPTLIAGVFSDPVIKPSDHGQGYVFIKYTFELKPQHTVPEGGNIQVVFPSSFVLSSSSPKPYCSSMLLDPVDSSEVLCTVTSNTVSLSNFKEVVPGALAYVYVKGVKNPSTASPGAFTFRTRNVAGRIIDQDTSLNTVVLTSAWTVQTITDLIIKPNPSSANATAIYSLEFTPSKFLGSGGKIQIVFPLREFGIIDIPPVCKIDYGVTMFASCTASASTIILTTSSDSRPMKTLISIMNLRNFDEGTSDEFMLTTSYDGVTLQATQTATYFAVTTTQAPSLNMRSLTFYPKNEGELATYQFYFTPQFDIELDDYILITFPNQFDHLLGENFYC